LRDSKVSTGKAAAIAAVVGILGTIFGASGGFFQVLYFVAPGAKQPDEISADVKIVGVERNITWDQYQKRLDQDAPPPSEEGEDKASPEQPKPCEAQQRRKLLGNLAYVQIKTAGFNTRLTQLRWAVYDKRRNRVSNSLYSDTAVLPPREAQTDRSIYRAWVPVPSGKHFVRFELLTQKTEPEKETRPNPCANLPKQTGIEEPPVLLAVEDSRPFGGQRSRSSR